MEVVKVSGFDEEHLVVSSLLVSCHHHLLVPKLAVGNDS